jgi:hypothetical protein
VATDSDIFTLHRYFIWQNRMREHFYDGLAEARAAGRPITHGTDEMIEAFLYMSYWYGGLYVVIEGWRDLKLKDETIDRLLDSPNLDLLRRSRNGVFHYQPRYFDERFVALIRDGQDILQWVRELNEQFGRYFLDWLEFRKAGAGGKAVESSDGEQPRTDHQPAGSEPAQEADPTNDGD